MKQNNMIKNFSKTFRICFILSFRNARSWFFIILTSLFISIITLVFYSIFFKSNKLLSPQILAISSISFFISPIYFSLSINEWKSNNIIKRLKFIQSKKSYVILSFIIVSYFFAILCNIILIMSFFVISKILKEVNVSYLDNLFIWNWFWFIFANFFTTFIVFCVLTILNNIMSNKQLCMLITIITTIFLILSSDILIQSFTSSKNIIINTLGYFSPTRYPIWIILLTSSFTFIDYDGGIHQLIFQTQLSDAHIFITKLWIAILATILISLFAWFSAERLFKWK